MELTLGIILPIIIRLFTNFIGKAVFRK